MSFTNASPLMSVTRSKEPFFGTNPISLSAPSSAQNDDFVLDMATSVVALGKIEFASRKNESIPSDWVIDKNGHSTTDPNQFHALLPLGGPESSSGYKGYGLATLVEILTSILAGATSAPNVRKWTANSDEANLGQCFVAIDPNCFAPGFEDRMQTLNKNLRSQDPVVPSQPILVHGDPERSHMEKCQQLGGIEYHNNIIQMTERLAKKFQINPMESIAK
ncbi:hypothetical protein SSS_10571 [Sarcoptes scabiei]|nr:hypothetical protein SSS_10571 [Sarcoptes scabiei]